jgi:uncharacterized protein (TIGR00730 family)
MREIKNICVFCGSSPGASIDYSVAARELGRLMSLQGIGLVYGGSNIGLMRAIADEMLTRGSSVVGVMPQGLIDREVAYSSLEVFHVVDSMSRRKELMAELSDAFITMPGGIGTLDELFEAMSWNQLDIIDNPVALLNTNGYYDHMIKFLEHTVDQKFVRAEHFSNLIIDSDPARLLEKISNYQPLKVDSKWIDDIKEQTRLANNHGD